MAKDAAGPEKSAGARVSVLLPVPVDRAYDYAVPGGVSVQDGDYVTVPWGRKTVTGVVWGPSSGDAIPANKIKSILAVHDDIHPMTKDVRRFIDWVAPYTMSPLGSVLKMALSVPAAFEAVAGVKAYLLSPSVDPAVIKPGPRRRIADLLADGIARRGGEIAEKAGAGDGVVRAMVKDGLLIAQEVKAKAPCHDPDIDRDSVTLSQAQHDVALSLKQRMIKGGFDVTLIDGVTGSGKTEVYFEAVADILRAGKQVLILLPEIALSNAFIDRFKSRFGCAPALWHSALTPAQRRVTWRGIANGESRVIVGARSALFLPYPDLGLIIVDEEHDPAFKQEEGVIYQARDMAVVRAKEGAFPIVLVSATPSLETMNNIWQGKYHHLSLPDRFGVAAKPAIRIVDLTKDKPPKGEFLSPVVVAAMRDVLARGEQSLLFLNRRGYAPLTLCRTCGHRIECPRCTAWLVEHRATSKLQCHHCGYSTTLPSVCPSCNDTESFVACGPGVERILEEVKTHFPQARTKILASDQTETQADIRQALDDIHAGAVDIIVGTQIIAKGHHFPSLTLVGIVDADLGLAGGDLRASERTFQLLHQVAGRAGRAEKPGTVYVQSWNPHNKVIQALAQDDRDRFLDLEARERQRARMPPFARLASVIVKGQNEGQATLFARELMKRANPPEGVRILGPAQAPIYRIRGYYRLRFLIQAEKSVHVQSVLDAWLSPVKVPAGIDVTVDIDPQSFL